jgi:DNA-binding winged helix-turn-helix (wHTH) protein
VTRRIKEYVLVVEVFDREASYNAQIDPIVRVEAGRVRSKLKEYYGTEGRENPLVIEFPKGSYVPVFKMRDATLHEKPQGPTAIEGETGAIPFPIGGVGRELYDFGPFRLDIAERVLTKGRQAIPLTPQPFDTLVVIVRNTVRVVEKDQLLKLVWPDAFVEEGVLAVIIAAIRKAFSDSGDGQSYETVPRRGYRFIGHIRAGSELSDEGVLAKVSKHYAKPPTMLVLFGLAWYVAHLPSNLPFPPARMVRVRTADL